MPARPEAEAIVTRLPATPSPTATACALLYVRTLATAQRYADAIGAARDRSRATSPTCAPPWLTLGALQLELRQPAEATAALQRYVQLVAGRQRAAARAGAATADDDDDDDDAAASADAGR